MKLTVIKNFNWAHAGVRVEEFVKDAVIDTEDLDLIEVSTREGWTKKPGKPATAKAPAAAPENKAERAAPEIKAELPVESPVEALPTAGPAGDDHDAVINRDAE